MKDQISLKKLYDVIVDEFPGYNHDPKIFLEKVLEELELDLSRTSQIHDAIQEKELKFNLLRSWPLNDFLDASYNYLISVGVYSKQATTFRRKYGFGKCDDLLYK